MKPLDKEEQGLMESVERGEWVPIKDQEQEAKKLESAAKATFVKDSRMNIRIAKRDLDALKIKAMEEGIPYQTLVSSIIHKYLSGKLVERET
ncbi:MAG TPA: antitoxin, partial [Desulfobacterales bacterium]|nr:antitoxin [Desulfobacterales bacterium]